MTNTSHKILFFGTEDFSAISLRALVESGFDVVGVVTKPDSRKGRGQKLIEPEVKTIATSHGIPVWQPTSLSEIADDIRALQPIAGVLVSYGKIIPQSIIDLFEPGIINVHPSLLPKYRGPSPIESTIINGDSETGVTIMQLSARMDAGPTYAQEVYPLSGTETQSPLYQTLGERGAQLLVKSLPAILDGSLRPVDQIEELASYCKLLEKSDAELRPSTFTAAELERKVRAHLAFPRSKTAFQNHSIIVTDVSVADSAVTPLDLECRDGAYLVINEVIAPSGKKMNAEAFIRGYAV